MVEPRTGDRQVGEEVSRDIYTVANIVTVLRLILVPIFFSVLLNGGHDVIAFILFAVAASTDWLDGQIARRTGTVTVIGKAIDPLVDRLLIAAGVLGLYVEHRLPLWTVLILVARDGYLLWGAWRLERNYKRRLPVLFIGKVTTAVLLAGFSDLILNWPRLGGAGLLDSRLLPGLGASPAAAGIWFIYAGVVLSLVTAVAYTLQASRLTHEVKETRGDASS